MASLAALRQEAKGLGIPAATIRAATTASELQAVINDHGSHDRPRKKKHSAARKSTRTVAKKRTTTKRTTTRAAATRGNSARKASAPVKSRSRGTTKRPSTSTRGARTQQRTSSYVAKGGRSLLADDIDYSLGAEDGWNARNGSAPDRIVKALKKFRGNREKVFDALVGDVWFFVGKKKADGSKRTLAEAKDMLRYRISRTAWDYAIRTGQHEAAENRVEYGTGDTGMGVWKPAKKAPARKTASKPATRSKAKPATSRQKAAPVRRGRGAGSKPATATRGRQKAAQSRTRGRARATSRR